VRETADLYARGRAVYCLEGGYDVATLAAAVAETLRAHDAPANGERADAAAIPLRQRAIADAVDAWDI